MGEDTRASAEPGGPGMAAAGSGGAGGGHRWTGGAVLLSRVLLVMMLVALLTGPVGLLVASWAVSTRSPAAAPPPAPTVDGDGGRTALAASTLAERYVEAWLRSTRTDPGPVQAFLTVDSAALPVSVPVPVPVTRVVAVERDLEGVWLVDVAAGVTSGATPAASDTGGVDLGEDSNAEATVPEGGVRVYRVRVMAQEGAARPRLQVSRLPYPVPPPVVIVADVQRARFDVPPRSELGTTMRSWLEAYLLGAGDPTRFAAPGAEMPLLPIAYASLQVIHLRSDVAPDSLAGAPGVTDEQAVQAVTVEALVRVTEAVPVPPGATPDPTALPETDEAPAPSPAPAREAVVELTLTLSRDSGRWEITGHGLGPSGDLPAPGLVLPNTATSTQPSRRATSPTAAVPTTTPDAASAPAAPAPVAPVPRAATPAATPPATPAEGSPAAGAASVP